MEIAIARLVVAWVMVNMLATAHKTGCYIKEIDDVIPFGEVVSPVGICYRIECLRHRLDYASCEVMNSEVSNCYVSDEDLSRPYPDCCPQVKCEEDNYLI